MVNLPSYDEALAMALPAAHELSREKLHLYHTVGRVLGEDITADRDQPPFDRSAMDGFALRAEAWAAGKAFRIMGTVPAGGVLPAGLDIDPARDVVRIATGAAVPDMFDAVVQIEKAVVTEGDGGEAAVVFEVDAVKPWMKIHRRGADAAAGATVIRAGTLLGPHHVGIAAAAGAVKIEVRRRPRVVVLSSGDEVRPTGTPTDELGPQQIRDSNGPMLVALLGSMGCEVLRHDHVSDEAEAVVQACIRAATNADLVVTAGGVSVGQRDLFPATWPTLGYDTVLHGVKMQPGKPVFIARPPGLSATDFTANPAVAPPYTAVVVGLPGNPVSVLATAHLFVWPMVRKMLGLDCPHDNESTGGSTCGIGGGVGGGLPWRRVWLASPVKPNPKREAFRAARFVGDTREQVEVVPWQGSGDLTHTAAAEGWVRLPAGEAKLSAGTGLSFLSWLGGGASPGIARQSGGER